MRRRVPLRGQPLGEARVATARHRHHVGGQFFLSVGPGHAPMTWPQPHPRHCLAVRGGDQARGVDLLPEMHVRQGGDPATDAPVDQVAAAGEQLKAGAEPEAPTEWRQDGQVAGIVEQQRPGHQEIRCQAGEEPLQSHPAPFQQDVDVPGLRQSLAVGRRLGEVVALQQGDLLEVVGQDARRQHPGHAAPNDHGMAAGDGPGRSIGGTERCEHRILLVSNGVSQDLRDRIVIHAPLVDYDSGFREQRSKIQRSAVQFTGQRKVAAGPEARRASYHDGASPLPTVTAASARPDPERASPSRSRASGRCV